MALGMVHAYYGIYLIVSRMSGGNKVKTKTKMLVYNVYVIVLEMSGVGQHVERPTPTLAAHALIHW